MKKRRLIAILLSCMVLANPIEVKAAENYDTYSFTDYGLVVSVPDSLDLEYDSLSGTFTGKAEVMVKGTSSTAGVSISTGTDITYVNESDSTLTADGVLSFGDSGTATWTKEEIQAGNKAEILGIEVSSFPMAEGTYSANISYNITAQKIVDTNKDEEYFCYGRNTYTDLDGVTYSGYEVRGFSKLGYEHFFNDCDASDTISLSLPYSYKGEPVIMVDGISNSEGYTFKKVFQDENMPNIEITFSKNIKYVRYFGNGSSVRSSLKLTGLTLNEGLEYIDDYAFDYHAGLTSIELPSTVRHIGENAFNECPLTGDLVIPDSIETIGDFAFCETKLNNLIIPKYINFGKAFRRHVGSTSSFLYDSVTINADSSEFNKPDVSYWWFNTFAGLSKPFDYNQIITFNDGIFKYVQGKNSADDFKSVLVKMQYDLVITGTSDNVTDGVLNASAYKGDKSLLSVIVEDSVTGIGNYAFSGSSLTSISLPNNISAGTEAFSECSIKSVILPDGFKANGKGIFKNADNLESVVCEGTATFAGSDFSNCDKLTSVELGSGIITIPSYMFSYCKNLKTVTIPSGVTKILNDAFYRCGSLREIYLPKTLISLPSYSSSWSGLPSDCTIFFEGTTEEFNAIKNVSYLTSNISNIVCLGDTATLEEPMIEVATSSDAEPVEYLTISGVSILTYEDLKGMTSLIELTLDKDILEIEEDAFQDCVSLESIIYEGTEEDWNSVIGIEFVPIADIIFTEIWDEDVPELATPSDATPNDEVIEEDISEEVSDWVLSDDISKEEVSDNVEAVIPSDDATSDGVLSDNVETVIPSDEIIEEEPSKEDIKFEDGEPIEEDDKIEIEVEEVVILPKEEDIVGDAESEEVAESSESDGGTE